MVKFFQRRLDSVRSDLAVEQVARSVARGSCLRCRTGREVCIAEQVAK
jgi:hypothetical protein